MVRRARSRRAHRAVVLGGRIRRLRVEHESAAALPDEPGLDRLHVWQRHLRSGPARARACIRRIRRRGAAATNGSGARFAARASRAADRRAGSRRTRSTRGAGTTRRCSTSTAATRSRGCTSSAAARSRCSPRSRGRATADRFAVDLHRPGHPPPRARASPGAGGGPAARRARRSRNAPRSRGDRGFGSGSQVRAAGENARCSDCSCDSGTLERRVGLPLRAARGRQLVDRDQAGLGALPAHAQ